MKGIMFLKGKDKVFTEEMNEIALSSNGNKIMQSIDSIKTDAYGMSNDLVSEKEVINATM